MKKRINQKIKAEKPFLFIRFFKNKQNKHPNGCLLPFIYNTFNESN